MSQLLPKLHPLFFLSSLFIPAPPHFSCLSHQHSLVSDCQCLPSNLHASFLGVQAWSYLELSIKQIQEGKRICFSVLRTELL